MESFEIGTLYLYKEIPDSSPDLLVSYDSFLEVAHLKELVSGSYMKIYKNNFINHWKKLSKAKTKKALSQIS